MTPIICSLLFPPYLHHVCTAQYDTWNIITLLTYLVPEYYPFVQLCTYNITSYIGKRELLWHQIFTSISRCNLKKILRIVKIIILINLDIFKNKIIK